MARSERKYHPNFVSYQKAIVNHPNYKGLPEAVDSSGNVKWVTAGKSDLGKRRELWWLAKGAELKARGVQLAEHAKLSPIALANHPTKTKVCQTCGKELSLEYVYLAKNTIKSINKMLTEKLDENGIVNVFDLADRLYKAYGNRAILILNSGFPGCISTNLLNKLKDFIRKNYVERFSKRLGPGAMSNCPDRLDGFHSYNRCCRGEQDTGRHSTNLAKYGEDRRAYENWADGDWKAASWLMKVFNKYGVSPDHIGPISLGFCHRPVFRPMSKQQNSSKGNRLTYADVERLINEEGNGKQVISWHSAPLWNKIKKLIKNDTDALHASKYMRRNMHFILAILAHLKKAGLSNLLETFLNTDYAYFSIKFEDFNPQTGEYKKLVKVPGSRRQYSRNAERYKRIAFEKLDKYLDKENRRVSDLSVEDIKLIVDNVEMAYKKSGADCAKTVLISELDNLAMIAYINFMSGVEINDQ